MMVSLGFIPSISPAAVLSSLGSQSSTDASSIEEFIASLDSNTLIQLPSLHDYLSLVQDCRKKKHIRHADRLYLHLCENGLDTHSELENYIVPMFVECGRISMAQQFFNRLSFANAYSWNFLIQGYHECGQFHYAFDLFDQMQEMSIRPSKFTYVALLKACARLTCIEEGHQLHAEVVKNGFEEDMFIGTSLIDLYAKCGLLEEARQLFDDLPDRDAVLWTALIAGYADHGLGVEALDCLDHMIEDAIPPNKVTFICSLKACGITGNIKRGQELHSKVIERGLERDLFLGNTLVDMYAKTLSFDNACYVLKKAPIQDVVSWNSLIMGYADNGLSDEAFKCFTEMKQINNICLDSVTLIGVLKACISVQDANMGREVHAEIIKEGFDSDLTIVNALIDMYMKCDCFPDAGGVFEELQNKDLISWNTLIAGCSEHGFDSEALNLLEKMQLNDTCPNAVTFSSILKACANLEDIIRGRLLHIEVTRAGLEGESFLCNSLIDMYSRCGYIMEAQHVFHQHLSPDILTWNILIAGYADLGHGEQALECLHAMKLENINQNPTTFVCVLKACKSLGCVNKVQEIHARIIEDGYERKCHVANSLLDSYASFGLLADAYDIYSKMNSRDIVTWNALMTGYVEYGLDEQVFKYMEVMQSEGTSPDHVSLLLCIKACINMGALEIGRDVYSEIIKRGMEGDSCIGSSIVDMYGKCGSMVEARKVFDSIDIQDVVSWTVLISGYALCGHEEDALACMKEMQAGGVQWNTITFSCIFRACSNLANGLSLHVEAIKEGSESEINVGNSLIDMYAHFGLLKEAKEVFNELPFQDVVSWNALMSGYADHGESFKALECYEQMQSEGFVPNEITYLFSLKACGNIWEKQKGQQIHSSIVKQGLEGDPFIGNMLITMYSKCYSFAESEYVYNVLRMRDAELWTDLAVPCDLEHRVKAGLNHVNSKEMEAIIMQV